MKEEAVIGIDLGTSQTKVVVSAHNRDLHYAINFSPNDLSINGYLKPTLIYINKKQETSLIDFQGSSPTSNLKLKFINWAIQVGENNLNSESIICAQIISYLAHIIRESKIYFKDQIANSIKAQDFEWMMNLGIPASSVREPVLPKAFELAAYASWDLACGENPITIHNAICSWKNISDENYKPGGTHRDYINIYPELAAQIVGFIRSKYGRDGLYLMIDVGAGTLDVSLFDTQIKIGHQNINYYTGCVEMLGVLELFLDTRNEIRTKKNNPAWGENILPNNLGVLPFNELLKGQDQKKLQSSFLDKCCSAVFREIFRAKMSYFGKTAPNKGKLSKGLPYFLCGGGSNIQMYKDIIKKVSKKMRIFHFKGFNKEMLSKPDNLMNLKNVSNDNYHRISVAYGLSYAWFNLPNQKGFKNALLDQPKQVDKIINTRRCRMCNSIAAFGSDLCYRHGFDT